MSVVPTMKVLVTQGIPGVGVPAGGSTGQVLVKLSGSDYDTGWSTDSGPVLSVFGRSGAVTAQTGDYTAAQVTNAVAQGAVTGSGLTMATARLLGRTTASTGAIEQITVGSGLSLTAGSLTATGLGAVTTDDTLSGDGTVGDPLGVAITLWDGGEL